MQSNGLLNKAVRYAYLCAKIEVMMPMEQNSEIDQVAIVGAGSIGAAWAVVFARAGIGVALYDPDAAQRDAARDEISARVTDLAEFELIDETPPGVLARIAMKDTLGNAVSGAHWVQECAPEDLDLKRSLFADLNGLCPDNVILASSSSALCVSKFVPDPQDRRRCLVVHPGNPPTLLPVAEVVPSPETDKAVADRAMAFLREAGMKPVLVRAEVEGFVYNRLQGAVLREAYCLVRDGVVDPDDIDMVMREGLGLRWSVIGPFETVDLNTRGGIAAHADRLGPAYERMGAERGQHDPWTPDMVAQVSGARRQNLPMEQWHERRGWRDRMLMAMVRAKRGALARFGS